MADPVRVQTTYGVGIGWRPEIGGFVEGLPGLRFAEVVAESVHAHGDLPPGLRALLDRGVTVVPHGVRLSLGGAEAVEPARVEHFAAVAERLNAPLVSEHIAFVRAGGVEAGHLLPLPRTREAVDAVVANVRRVQAAVAVPIALEPIAALFDWPGDELTEAQFIGEILDRSGAMLLLDIANVYANARNRGDDPLDLLDQLPLDRVAYVHVAGGAEHQGLYHDTHTDAVPQPVLDLVAELCARHRPPALMLERDGDYPPAAALAAELDAIAGASGYPTVT
ncbi:DUF692 domain-containing protein [Paractinoplanes brasiliensis]|uniref:Uncharacterized protein n=1 Tax=Paractinoplanes brasiliensis TaxID=52695 RepID=A0A4R6JRL5_9ACTN|nr:DUF692 domain-containing protein [Actinoplanes brasiliensis]TDO37556.1 hypothetical protein C8E87_1187 [Actinoplanes brasiliensis]GID31876.1 hypothetical protein Abr02nite_68590 [Actinoplanes brasiliensis]